MSTVETLTKEAIVSAVAAETALTKAAVESVVNGVLNEIRAGLLAGKTIRLTGVGTLTTKTASARTCRNVRAGGTVEIPARKVVKFNVASELKTAVAELPVA